MFVVSKVAEVLLQPLNLPLFALWAAAVLLRGRHAAWGRAIVLVTAVALLVVGALPSREWVMRPLEDRFPPPVLGRVDGVIVLGGAIDPVVSAERGQPSLNSAAERLTALIELGRRYPEARLVYSGGSGSVLWPDAKEAPVARILLDSLGFDTSRVVFEEQSRNTWENAVYSRALVHPRPGETWLLVTSALHMPRSVGVFRAAGWPVVAYPVDYQTAKISDDLSLNVGRNANAVFAALHEWVGLVYYRLRGWSDSWFPAPL